MVDVKFQLLGKMKKGLRKGKACAKHNGAGAGRRQKETLTGKQMPK